jgi:serine/threonine-protein phosphatase Stp1
MTVQPLFCHSASATHTGMVRELNEDSLIARDDTGIWAVADGMGGHQAGEVASQQITHSLGNVPVCQNVEELLHATTTALKNANSELIAMGRQYDSSRMPGSTVVALVIHGDKGVAVWAGDSRLYRLRNGHVEQISRDHSHVQELMDQHLISPEEAESHPMANVITRAVGIEDPLELDTIHFEVADGDQFLLCSDGLSRLMSPEEMQGMMQSSQLEESVQLLLHTALIRGAPDNVTLVTVQCSSEEGATEEITRRFPING